MRMFTPTSQAVVFVVRVFVCVCVFVWQTVKLFKYFYFFSFSSRNLPRVSEQTIRHGRFIRPVAFIWTHLFRWHRHQSVIERYVMTLHLDMLHKFTCSRSKCCHYAIIVAVVLAIWWCKKDGLTGGNKQPNVWVESFRGFSKLMWEWHFWKADMSQIMAYLLKNSLFFFKATSALKCRTHSLGSGVWPDSGFPSSARVNLNPSLKVRDANSGWIKGGVVVLGLALWEELDQVQPLDFWCWSKV